MPLNIEIKASCADFALILSRLNKSLGVERVELNQEDVFFAVPRGRLKMRCDEAFNGSEMIYYRRDFLDGLMISRYFRQPVFDAENKRLELEQMYGVKGVVRKHRIAFISGDIRVHLDDVEGLGQYIEIEILVSEETEINDAMFLARRMMKVFNIKNTDLIVDAYEDLLERT